MIKALILTAALYCSFVLVVQVIINLIKAHGVNIMRAHGHTDAKGGYADHTALGLIACGLWGVLYYVCQL